MKISCNFPLALRWLPCVLQSPLPSVALSLPRLLTGSGWQTLRLPSVPQPPPISPSLCPSDALLPGLAGEAVAGRNESAAPTPAPFPLLLSNTRQGFFPFLPGSEWAHSLREPRPFSSLLPGVSSDLRSAPVPLPPAGSAPSEQPNGIDRCLQSGFLLGSGMRRGWTCLGGSIEGGTGSQLPGFLQRPSSGSSEGAQVEGGFMAPLIQALEGNG